MTIKRFTHLPASLLLASAAAAALPAADATEFESLRDTITADLGAVNDDQIISLLATAKAAHQPFAASLVVKNYLAKQFNPKPQLLLAAAENAVLAGELAGATGYYKRFLRDAAPSEQASRAAVALYNLLINQLGDADEAYAHMVRYELKFRAGIDAAGSFDSWFLSQARKRREYAPMVMGLRKMFADSPSLGRKHQYLWPALKTGLEELRFAKAKDSATVEAFAGLIDNAGLPADQAAALKWYVAVFEYRKIIEVDGQKKANARLGNVIEAAKTYVKTAPTAGRLAAVCWALGLRDNGRDWDSKVWGANRERLLPMVVELFGQLPERDQSAFANRRLRNRLLNDLGDPIHWYRAGAKDHRLYNHDNLGGFSLGRVLQGGSKMSGHLTELAAMLGKSDNNLARVVRTLQTSGGDLRKAAEQWFGKESATINGADVVAIFDRLVAPGISHLKGGDDEAARKQAISSKDWIEAVGIPWLASSPVLQGNRDGAWRYLDRAWQGLDRAAFAEAAKKLAWIPFNRHARDHINRFYRDRIRRHYDGINRRLQRERKRLKPEEISRFEADLKTRAMVEQAVQGLTSGKNLDVSAAPNPLAKAYLEIAMAGADDARFDAAAQVIVDQAGSFIKDRTAFGRLYMQHVLWRTSKTSKVTAVQGQALERLLGNWGAGSDGVIRAILNDTFHRNRHSWPHSIAKEDRAAGILYNNALAGILRKQVGAGAVDRWLWDRFFQTRRGRGWHDSNLNADVLKRAIDTGAIEQIYHENNRLGWVDAMYLVAREAPGLKKDYPVDSWFDGKVAAEIGKKQFIHNGYWDHGGKDKQGTVASAAAAVLAGYQTLPSVKGAPGTRYSSEDFGKVQWRVLGESKAKIPADAADKMTAHFGKRYDSASVGDLYFARIPNIKDAGQRSEFFKRLTTVLDRLDQMPFQMRHPNMRALEARDFTFSSLNEGEIGILVRMIADHPFPKWGGWNGSEGLAINLTKTLAAQGRWRDLIAVAPSLWRAGAQLNRADIFQALLGAAEQSGKDNPELAASIASGGLAVAKSALDDSMQRSLASIIGKVRSASGAINVAKNDPRYPVFLAQRNWQVGMVEGAWDSYREEGAGGTFAGMYSELDPMFIHWVLSEHIRRDQLVEAETMVQSVMTWLDGLKVDIGAEVRAQLLLTQADIPFKRKQYPVARSKYMYIVESEEFDRLRPQLVAQLKIADVDRLTRRFDSARQILDKLERRPDTYVRAMAKFYKAKLAYDEEQYVDAAELIEQSLELYEDNTEARLLQADVNMKSKRFVDASRIEIGSPDLRTKLIPGKPLTVMLRDKTKKLFGRASNVELSVWTEGSQDKETLLLAQTGEDGTIYSAAMPTEMAPVQAGDGKLQVVGNDTVYFDMSDAFKERTNYQGKSTKQRLRVQSDAELYASSSEIQTQAELEELRIREMIAAAAGIRAGGGDAWAEEAGIALSEVRAMNEIRPGNAFNLRVIDLDRNYTDGLDNVAVSISTSSGDRIKAHSLTETEAFSGSFEAKVQTAKRPAYAIASDYQPGHDPNAVVSPNTSGTLPPWVGAAGLDGARHLSVDLNDLVEIGKTKIVVGELERAPSRIVVQTSLNNRTFETIGAFPTAFTAWDGSPQIDVIPVGLAGDYETIKTQFDVHYLDEQSGRARVTPAGGTVQVDFDSDLKSVWGAVAKKIKAPKSRDKRRRGNAPASMLSVRSRSAFWVDERTTKTFYLIHGMTAGGRGATGPQLYIDGQLVNGGVQRGKKDAEATGPQGHPFELSKGLHVMELIYQVPSDQGAQATVAVKTSIPTPPYTAEVGKDLFDLAAVPPAVMQDWLTPAVTISQDATTKDLDLDFAGIGTRVVKFWIMEHGGDAPAIRQIQLADVGNKQVLPIAQDYTELLDNDILEIAPGDKVTVTYEDPHTYDTQGSNISEAYLNSTYHNGGINASFVTTSERGEEGFATIRRFDIGDEVMMFVRDNDLDITDAEDRTLIQVVTSEGKKTELPAVETGPHTGVFRTTLFPVSGEPQRGSEIQVKPGDDVTLSYVDDENTEPGIPWTREAMIEQAVWTDPEFRVFNTISQPLPMDEIAAMEGEQADEAEAGRTRRAEDRAIGIRPLYRMVVERPEASLKVGETSAATAKAIIGGPLLAEVKWPTVCKSSMSRVKIYAQTKKGREQVGGAGAAGMAPAAGFDITVPGTIELVGGPRGAAAGGEGDLPVGYSDVLQVGAEGLGSPMDEGLFGFSIPMELGDCPTYSLATDEGKERAEKISLFVSAGDEIYVGFTYEDQSGQEHWFTQTVQLAGDSMFDVMDRHYEQYITERYVGEQVFLRVVDSMANVSGKKDGITVTVTTKSGLTQEVELIETLSHSGIFKGLVEFVHQKDEDGIEAKQFQNGVAVAYGDEVTLTYAGSGVEHAKTVSISKGADGGVVPFTKKFKDPEIAMRTMFSIAEAYFEMAKKHRALGESAAADGKKKDAERLKRIARSEINQGRKLLTEAIRDFPENDIRAQADYLRAELALELAKDTKLEGRKQEYYTEALQLFGDIIARYPDSEYAPKAQFKKALVYEKMDEMELACAEYVKLSYKYPGNELIAETIARLGNYFLGEGDKLNKQAEEEDGKDDIKAAQLRMNARDLFNTAGSVFSKLREHFPDHNLAAKTTVAAGMCMMWAENWQEAHDMLSLVTNDSAVQDPDVKSEAYYWLGDTYVRMIEKRGATIKIAGATTAFDPASMAYQTFMKLTWEYPETKWARYARGQLASGGLTAPQ